MCVGVPSVGASWQEEATGSNEVQGFGETEHWSMSPDTVLADCPEQLLPFQTRTPFNWSKGKKEN